MNKKLSLRQVLVIFAVVLVFLITVASLAYNRLVSLVESNETINQYNGFVLKMEEVISYLKDAETGARGYVLTGDTVFLSNQRHAGKKVMNYLVDLRQSVKGIDEQIPYIDSIQRMSKTKIDNIWVLVHSIKPGQVKPLTEEQQKTMVKGKIVMDSIRATVQNLKNLQQDRLNINIDKQREFAASSPRFLLIIIISAISVIILTMGGIYRQLLLLKKAQKKLEEKIRELAHANRELDQYAFTLSHHLQEPLRKIRMFSSRYEAKLKKDALIDPSRSNLEGEKELEAIRKINTFAADSQYLLDEFLAFANLSQKNKNDLAAVPLSDIIEEAWDEKSAFVSHTHAQYQLEGDAQILGYKKHLITLFEQLIDNALKFRHPDRNPLMLFACKTEMMDEKPCHVITITDNGIGFEQEYADKIFSIFQRLNHKNQYSGLGVGLAISRKIVELHNGTIAAESSPDIGSVFVIKIPCEMMKYE